MAVTISAMPFFVLISNSGGGGGGVQLGPLDTSATISPIVPAPGDYEDGEFGGMIIGRGNRSTQRKSAPAPLCTPRTPHDLTGRETGPPATNRLSYDTAFCHAVARRLQGTSG
jgi:hypothetical protein